MKKLLCPKCDHPIVLDETRYTEGQTLVFVCEECKKQFTVKVRKAKPKMQFPYGAIVVVENRFAFKQVIPLQEGDNVIGRYSKGTEINTPIDTQDPSVDRRHCIITVKPQGEGQPQYTLRDNPSITGTFVMNRILRDNERLRIDPGTIITIGATTLILKSRQELLQESRQ